MFFKIMIIGLLLAALLLVVLCKYYNQALQCEYYTVTDAQVPEEFDGMRIVLISDLHEHQFGKENEKLLQRILEQKPDCVMIAGDLLIKGTQLRAYTIMEFLKKLCQEVPVYYAPGNHEEYLERECDEGVYEEYLDNLEKIGVKYLANQTVEIKKNGAKLFVTGLHLQKKFFAKFYEKVSLEKEDIEKLLGKKREGYEILLAHNPTYFPVYSQWGANLVLSGHVHGGIIILPFIGGLISTTYQLLPKYDFGKFQEGDATMILSKGLGVHTIKVRLFNKPEIAVITLQKTCVLTGK